MAREQSAERVPIGQYDILATYTYARALLDGLDDGESVVFGSFHAHREGGG